jgi:hypothetical protein
MTAKIISLTNEKGSDPLNVNIRLYKQVAKLLDSLEHDDGDLGIKERIAALIAIGRIQTIFVGLRKEHRDGAGSGSAVKKYSSAFQDVARRRKANTRTGDDDADDDFGTDPFGGDDPSS